MFDGDRFEVPPLPLLLGMFHTDPDLLLEFSF